MFQATDTRLFREQADKKQTGAVTSDIADLPQKVQGLFGQTMGTIIQSCATLIGGCVIGLAYGPRE